MAEKKGVGHAYNIDFLNVVFAARRMQVAKANLDHDRYDFESSRVAKASNAASKGQKVAQEQKDYEALSLDVEKLAAARDAISKQLGQYTSQAATVQKQIDD